MVFQKPNDSSHCGVCIHSELCFQGSHAGAVGRYFSSHAYHHSSVTFVFILSSAVTVALGLLTCWHARLIARGETSIEVHINRKKSRELSSKGLVSIVRLFDQYSSIVLRATGNRGLIGGSH